MTVRTSGLQHNHGKNFIADHVKIFKNFSLFLPKLSKVLHVSR